MFVTQELLEPIVTVIFVFDGTMELLKLEIVPNLVFWVAKVEELSKIIKIRKMYVLFILFKLSFII